MCKLLRLSRIVVQMRHQGETLIGAPLLIRVLPIYSRQFQPFLLIIRIRMQSAVQMSCQFAFASTAVHTEKNLAR